MKQKLIESLSYILLSRSLVCRVCFTFRPNVFEAFSTIASCLRVDIVGRQKRILAEQAGAWAPKAETVTRTVHQKKRSGIGALAMAQDVRTFAHHGQKITGSASQWCFDTYAGWGWSETSRHRPKPHPKSV